MIVTVSGEPITEEEKQKYIEYVTSKKNPKSKLLSLNIHIDGDYADLTCEYKPIKFDRIRRITGNPTESPTTSAN